MAPVEHDVVVRVADDGLVEHILEGPGLGESRSFLVKAVILSRAVQDAA